MYMAQSLGTDEYCVIVCHGFPPRLETLDVNEHSEPEMIYLPLPQSIRPDLPRKSHTLPQSNRIHVP